MYSFVSPPSRLVKGLHVLFLIDIFNKNEPVTCKSSSKLSMNPWFSVTHDLLILRTAIRSSDKTIYYNSLGEHVLSA